MTLIIIAFIGLIVAGAYLVCAARLTDIKTQDNTGSETGIEGETK
jgi:sugar phosphate permease